MAAERRRGPVWVLVAAASFPLLVLLSYLTTAIHAQATLFPGGRCTLRVQDPEGNPIAGAEVVPEIRGPANCFDVYFDDYKNGAVPKSTNDGLVTLTTLWIRGGSNSWHLLWIWRMGSEPPRPIVIALRVSAPGYEPAWVTTDALFDSQGPLPVQLTRSEGDGVRP